MCEYDGVGWWSGVGGRRRRRNRTHKEKKLKENKTTKLQNTYPLKDRARAAASLLASAVAISGDSCDDVGDAHALAEALGLQALGFGAERVSLGVGVGV